jgi:hypothetical protein
MAEPVALQVKPPAPISLGDMLNLARGAQAYQQAEQINPLALQKAQIEIEQAKKINPLAVSKATEEVSQAQIGTKQKQLELDQSHFNLAGNILSGLEARAKVLEKKGDHETALKELKAAEAWMNASGIQSQDNGPTKLAEEQLKNKDFTGYLSTLENLRNVMGGAASRYQANLPKTTVNAAGQTVAVNPLTGQFDVMGEPKTNPMGVRTQTFTDPVTGNLIQAPVTPQGTLGAPSNIVGGQQQSPDIAPNKSPFSQLGKPLPQTNTPQAIPQGATAETVKAQATDAMNTFMSSSKLLSDASSLGHIPTQEDITKKLLTYIKDPKVRTGPIADALADASKEEFLTPKEQTVKKLIQQRIQNLSPRTDADAESKRAAYGSFKLKKEALEDLIRDDLGSINSQKLLAQGVVKAGGDPNRPNLQGVNSFKNEFTKFSQDKVLMKYIGIVGTKKTTSLDDSDKEALKKLYSTYKISKEDRNALEDAREELIKMSAGGR